MRAEVVDTCREVVIFQSKRGSDHMATPGGTQQPRNSNSSGLARGHGEDHGAGIKREASRDGDGDEVLL